jgi:hypothetical protein
VPRLLDLPVVLRAPFQALRFLRKFVDHLSPWPSFATTLVR